jgi:uncharacterized repeat protein (TIGR03803 family)
MNYKRLLGAASAALMIVIAVFMLAPGSWAASNYKTLHAFKGGADGGNPQGDLVFDTAGNLYGTTTDQVGEEKDGGTVFKLTPNPDGKWTKSVLYTFPSDGKSGRWPYAGLTFDTAGNLYGTTFRGGANEDGTVFKLTPNPDGSWTESVLYSFCSLTNCSDGGAPGAGLIFDAAGDLYGTTVEGVNLSSRCDGNTGCGTVFKLARNPDGTWTESVLYAFIGFHHGHDGAFPSGSVVFDVAGNLYGTTELGGDGSSICPHPGCGTVFKLTPNPDGTWTENVIHSFDRKDGSNPNSMIFDPAGNLYGTANAGGGHNRGVVFELTPNPDGSWTESVLHRFSGGKDGAEPVGPLIFDQAGNLYGMTVFGGNLSYCGGFGCGVVFKLAPNSKGGWTEAVLHFFASQPGASPEAGPIFDTAGNLYGTTNSSPNGGFGSVFEITP